MVTGLIYSEACIFKNNKKQWYFKKKLLGYTKLQEEVLSTHYTTLP